MGQYSSDQNTIQEREGRVSEYLRQKDAYRADRSGTKGDWTALGNDLRTVRVKSEGEIILAAGAFNTPQLLMNSGIGPAEHLQEMRIEVVADRPGVGRILQDRYEIPVIDQIDHEFALLSGISAYETDWLS
jgi:choline dehydrogenase